MRTRHTRVSALVAAASAALAGALLVVVAPSASAGGPTSVLVVNYDGQRAAGALTGSPDYTALETALDAYATPVGDRTAPTSFMGTQLRLTWMIHDVTPWRVDAISITGDDVWVETVTDTSGSADLFDTAGVRHRPKDAALLLSTLEDLGVIGDQQSASPPGPSARAAGETAAPGALPASAGATTGAPQTDVPTTLPWWATVAAMVLALGLGVVLGRRARPVPAEAPEADSPDSPVSVGTAGPEPVGFSADAPRHP
jgi:hypothetical protein